MTTAAASQGRDARDLRDELPDRLDGREAARVSRRPAPAVTCRAPTTPGPLLSRALDYINTELRRWSPSCAAQGLARQHRDHPLGQARPVAAGSQHADADQRRTDHRRDQRRPGPDGCTRAPATWSTRGTDDDAFPVWLQDRSQAAADFVKDYLWTHSATGNTYNAAPTADAASTRVWRRSTPGAAAARYFGVAISDPRHPDIWGVVQARRRLHRRTAKIAEHGGANPGDRERAAGGVRARHRPNRAARLGSRCRRLRSHRRSCACSARSRRAAGRPDRAHAGPPGPALAVADRLAGRLRASASHRARSPVCGADPPAVGSCAPGGGLGRVCTSV